MPLLGLGFTKDRGDDSETSRGKRFCVSETLFLVFVCIPSLGSKPSFCDHVFGLLASPTSLEPPRVAGVRSRGQLVFVIFIPQAFFYKAEGLSRAMILLDGRVMVLGELLTG